MKQVLKLTLVFAFLLAGATTFAQTVKLGHIDSQKLLQIMPDKDAVEKQIQAKAEEYQKGIQEMQAEHQNLVNKYLAEESSMDDAMRKTRSKEIQDLINRMQGYDNFAKKDISDTQKKLFKPILDKATKAIKDVATENGFTYVFDMSSGVILFNSEDSIDILPLVKAKLGIK
jgi:outer membrane protein